MSPPTDPPPTDPPTDLSPTDSPPTDAAELARYLETHRTRLTTFVRTIASDRLLSVIEADDLVQEIATAALSSFETAPLDQYGIDGWLRHLARRRVVDAHRYHFGAKRRDAGRNAAGGADDDLGQMLVASITSPSAVVSREIRLSALHEAIGELPADEQTAVRMRYLENRSPGEIANHIGRSEPATRVMLSRCIRRLEKTLQSVRPTR